MTRVLTLEESTKEQVFNKLRNRPKQTFGIHTSSRYLNKQLKCHFAPLQQDILKNLLNRIHQTLPLATKKMYWATILASMLVLAITTETVQVNIRCKEQTDMIDGAISNENATDDLELIEKNWDILTYLFRKAYCRLDPIWKINDRKQLDSTSQEFATKVKSIVEKHRKLSPSIEHKARILMDRRIFPRFEAISRTALNPQRP